jgi:uncharacterized membrane protein YbaN (DUF454 family)
MTTRFRLPREQRPRFQRLPLPLWLRVLVLTVGWMCILLGIAGLFLPVLQGGLLLAIGFALLSIGSQMVHLWLRRFLGRWPGLWKRLEKLRRKIHTKLHRRKPE